jgi:DNA sulfur modification protein DndB
MRWTTRQQGLFVSINAYSFAALRGQQGESEYFLIQCPLRLVPRLFVFDDPDVPAELRDVRTVNAERAAELAKHLAAQKDQYVLTSLVAAVDHDVEFAPLSEEKPDLGQLHIPLTARLILHDGQHRRAAIQHLLVDQKLDPHDTIPVMLFVDPQLTRSLRLYANLNQDKITRSASQRILHDQYSDLAELVRQLIADVPLFKGLTELEKSTISNRSIKLFTLSAIYQATRALLGVRKSDPISSEQAEIAFGFWETLGDVIPQWQQAIKRKVATASLRQNFVHVHSVTLEAIARAGHDLIAAHPDDWRERLGALRDVDWSRQNAELWEGRAMIRGKMSKSNESARLSANAIKQRLGLPLTDDEQELEQKIRLQQSG